MQLSFRVRMGTGALYMIWPSMSVGEARGLSPLSRTRAAAMSGGAWLAPQVCHNTSSLLLGVDEVTVMALHTVGCLQHHSCIL